MIKHKQHLKTLATATAALMLATACNLTKGPEHYKALNLKSTLPSASKGTEGYSKVLTQAGKCDRGVLLLDVVQDFANLAKDDEANTFAMARGYFTTETWKATEKMNPFSFLDLDVTNENLEKVIPKDFKVNKTASSFIVDLYTWNESTNTVFSSSLTGGDDSQLARPSKKTLQMSLNEKDGHYSSNVPDTLRKKSLKGEEIGNSSGYANLSESIGVGPYTHAAIGTPFNSEQRIFLTIPPAVDPSANLNNVFSVPTNSSFNIAVDKSTSGDESVVGRYFIVQIVSSENKPVGQHTVFMENDGSAENQLQIPATNLPVGKYLMFVKKLEIAAVPVNEDSTEYFCIGKGASATANLTITEKKKAE